MRIFKKIFLTLSLLQSIFAFDDYVLGPDSLVQPGVPQGKVTEYDWTNSKIFSNTYRKYWVYIPAQYDAAKPPCLMIFQDGEGFVRTNGQSHATIVMDNLIAKKEIPVMIGVFFF